jgi:hypothetical protein
MGSYQKCIKSGRFLYKFLVDPIRVCKVVPKPFSWSLHLFAIVDNFSHYLEYI